MNLKWIENLNIRAKAMKFLEENIAENLNDFGIFSVISQVQPIKEKIDKLLLSKLKTFVGTSWVVQWPRV